MQFLEAHLIILRKLRKLKETPKKRFMTCCLEKEQNYLKNPKICWNTKMCGYMPNITQYCRLLQQARRILKRFRISQALMQIQCLHISKGWMNYWSCLEEKTLCLAKRGLDDTG